MARIILASSMVRCPLGGLLSHALQYLKGFEMLGHDVFYFEKASYAYACYDPQMDSTGNNCSFGVQSVKELLDAYGLGSRWAFIDYAGQCHGMSRQAMQEIFSTADIFLDMGALGAGSWLEEADRIPVRILYEGEPGYTQMVMECRRRDGENVDEYDFYYTDGIQIGTPASNAPTAGQKWRHLWSVVATDLFKVGLPPAPLAAFTTVMTWRSHKPLEFDGITYGQKDVEFEKFMNLPTRIDIPMEVRVSGKRVPYDRLQQHGWRIPQGEPVTQSVKDYYAYIHRSAGEFSIAKNVFVQTQCGCITDRSGLYLASGRPVVLQDTGFSNHLPCGEGLFAVKNEDEAVEAIRRITSDYALHSRAARRVAQECLDAKLCLKRFISEIS